MQLGVRHENEALQVDDPREDVRYIVEVSLELRCLHNFLHRAILFIDELELGPLEKMCDDEADDHVGKSQ